MCDVNCFVMSSSEKDYSRTFIEDFFDGDVEKGRWQILRAGEEQLLYDTDQDQLYRSVNNLPRRKTKKESNLEKWFPADKEDSYDDPIAHLLDPRTGDPKFEKVDDSELKEIEDYDFEKIGSFEFNQGKLIMYDRENPELFIQSDTHYDLEEMR